MIQKSLYERLGGVFAIAAVIDHFSDEVVKNRKVGQGSPNPALNEWSTEEVDTRLPGLKFMRTLWVCDSLGRPFRLLSNQARGKRARAGRGPSRPQDLSR